MMLRLIYKAQHYNMGILLGVQDSKNELIAANFFINHPQRIINLMPTSNKEGLKHGAMAFLIEHLIEKNANQNKYLDFEGPLCNFTNSGISTPCVADVKIRLLKVGS